MTCGSDKLAWGGKCVGGCKTGYVWLRMSKVAWNLHVGSIETFPTRFVSGMKQEDRSVGRPVMTANTTTQELAKRPALAYRQQIRQLSTERCQTVQHYCSFS